MPYDLGHFVFIYKKINSLLESGGNFCPGEGGEGRLDLGQILLLLVCQGQAGQQTGQAVHHFLVLSEMKSELGSYLPMETEGTTMT